MTMTQQSRRRTRLWLATYTAVLIAITVAVVIFVSRGMSGT
jgi:hypothetical protein